MSQKKMHICVLCNTELETKDALQAHFRRHANKEIDLKGREVNAPAPASKEQVQDGKYIPGSGAELGTSVRCEECSEEFTCPRKAIQHKFKKHPKSQGHYCPQCGMLFPLKGHRDKHLQEAHKSETISQTPFPCFQCGAVFFTAAAYEYHDKTRHHMVVTFYKQVPTPPPSKKIKINNAGEAQSVYYCHLCGQEYVIKFNLIKHLERHHTLEERNAQPQEMLKCTNCDAIFFNSKAYGNHNNFHKPDDLYVLSEEQRLQTVSRVDQDFDIRRVQNAAEKYMPKYRTQRKSNLPKIQPTKKKESSDEEMSPPPSDSESDSEPPAAKRPPVHPSDPLVNIPAQAPMFPCPAPSETQSNRQGTNSSLPPGNNTSKNDALVTAPIENGRTKNLVNKQEHISASNINKNTVVEKPDNVGNPVLVQKGKEELKEGGKCSEDVKSVPCKRTTRANKISCQSPIVENSVKGKSKTVKNQINKSKCLDEVVEKSDSCLTQSNKMATADSKKIRPEIEPSDRRLRSSTGGGRKVEWAEGLEEGTLPSQCPPSLAVPVPPSLSKSEECLPSPHSFLQEL